MIGRLRMVSAMLQRLLMAMLTWASNTSVIFFMLASASRAVFPERLPGRVFLDLLVELVPHRLHLGQFLLQLFRFLFVWLCRFWPHLVHLDVELSLFRVQIGFDILVARVDLLLGGLNFGGFAAQLGDLVRILVQLRAGLVDFLFRRLELRGRRYLLEGGALASAVSTSRKPRCSCLKLRL